MANNYIHIYVYTKSYILSRVSEPVGKTFQGKRLRGKIPTIMEVTKSNYEEKFAKVQLAYSGRFWKNKIDHIVCALKLCVRKLDVIDWVFGVESSNTVVESRVHL